MVEVEGARKMVPSCATAAAQGMVVHTDTERVRHMRHLYLELLLSDHNSFCTPPCRDACPTHIKIPQFLDFIAHGDYKNGVRKLREDLPFPAVLGRVCPRPCEGPCRRQLVEHPITICWLHRFMADQCLDEEQEGELLLPVEPKADSGKRIAVVGGGPAGLACAFYARLEGHAVKIFEALPKPGGMLRYGIPSYRLPRDLLDKELNMLWRMGVELECDKRLGVDFQMEDLLGQYDAVFLGLGAFNSNEMGVENEDADGVVKAVDFLEELELTGEVHVGQKVTVIGGGFTAMDACRTSIRKGAKEVTCLYRRSRKEMPAHHTEVDEAEEEGVRLDLLVAPVKILVDEDRKVVGIEMLRMELGEPDDSGRRRPVPIEGSEFVVDCDQVITAIGQFPDLDGTSEEQGVKRTKWKTIAVDDFTFQTEDPRVFAGGDAVLGAQTVIQAVAQGKKAAWSIDAFLRGEDMPELSRRLAELKATPFFNALSTKTDLDPRLQRMAEIPPVFIDMTTDVSHPAPPADMPKLSPEERRDNFREIELGFTEDEAETRRRAVPGLLLPGQRQVRPAALRHRVRGLQEPLPRLGRPRLPCRLPPRFHHARAQPLHQLWPLRAHLPHGGRLELLRHHGTRLRHHRLDAGQPASADGGLRLVRQVRRDVPDRLHRDEPACAGKLRPRREPLHLLRRVRRGLPVRRSRADRLLRARRLQPHHHGGRVAVRARGARRRPPARDGHRPGAEREGHAARRRLGLDPHQG